MSHGLPGGHRHQRGFPVGERADDAGSAADLPVQPLDGVVRPDPGPMLHGEVGVGERLGVALAHDLGCRAQLHRLERVGHLGRLGRRGLARFLRMDGLEHLGDPRPLPPRHLAERVAVEADGAPLVSHLGENLLERPEHPRRLIAGDEPHARQPAPAQPQQGGAAKLGDVERDLAARGDQLPLVMAGTARLAGGRPLVALCPYHLVCFLV